MEERLTFAADLPVPDHVVIVVEENHSYSQIFGSASAPFINSLATGPHGALFTNSFGIEHPSQPNYLDLFSGSNQGVADDGVPANLPFTTDNLGAQLLANGKTFAGYSDGLPSVGFNGASSGQYVRKHNPWSNWQDSNTNGIPPALNKPFTSFPTNFDQLPTLSFVVPDQDHDMHDGTIAQADTWLKDNLGSYATWAQTHNSLLIVTWDEDDRQSNNQITTVFNGASVKGGQYTESIDHFDVLRTLEDMYSLPYAGAAATATPITDVWLNNVPTLMAIPAQVINSSGQLTVNLAGIAAGGGEHQALTVTAVSDNQAVIPNPTVNYNSPATTGNLQFNLPVPNPGDTANITVTIRDDGLDGIAGNADDRQVVNQFVVKVNTPPVAQLSNVRTLEDTPKTFAVTDFHYTDGDNSPLTSIMVSRLALASGDKLVVKQGGVVVNVSNGMTITAAEIPTLTYTPALNANGNNRSRFSFVVNDIEAGSVTAVLRLGVTAVNDKPVITGFGMGITYTGAKIAIAAATTKIADVDSADFNLGSLTVKMSVGGQPEDTFSIRSFGGITTDTFGNVRYNNVAIGKFKGGTGTTPLVITFNTQSNAAAVTQLAKNILYGASRQPSATSRTIWMQLNDGDKGLSTPVTKVLKIGV